MCREKTSLGPEVFVPKVTYLSSYHRIAHHYCNSAMIASIGGLSHCIECLKTRMKGMQLERQVRNVHVSSNMPFNSDIVHQARCSKLGPWA